MNNHCMNSFDSESSITTFAPVVIPTMNRYEHFASLIKSLQKNRYACETDVIIGLGYPSKADQIDGYEK